MIRLTLYKRISSARDIDALRDLQIEMIDRFGMLPDPIKQLFAIHSQRSSGLNTPPAPRLRT